MEFRMSKSIFLSFDYSFLQDRYHITPIFCISRGEIQKSRKKHRVLP